MKKITVHRLGQVEYEDGLKLQELFGEARKQNLVGDILILLEHPPVITLGRSAKTANILASDEILAKSGATVHPTNRGGDVTYHGPGQLVGYPIFQLGPGRKDVRRYVRDLEEIIIQTLAGYHIVAKLIPQWIGVWVDNERGVPAKIAAIGVHISRWQTSHGFALNVTTDLTHFEWIVPCGISEASVTSMARVFNKLEGEAHLRQDVETEIIRQFGKIFEAEVIEASAPAQTVSVVVVAQSEAGPRVLLLKRREANGGFWQIVTGRCRPEESPVAAAVRELLEETGQHLEVESLNYAHAFAYGSELPPLLYEETAFLAKWPSGAKPKLNTDEHDHLCWLSFEEACKQLPFVGLRKAVLKAQDAINPP